MQTIDPLRTGRLGTAVEHGARVGHDPGPDVRSTDRTVRYSERVVDLSSRLARNLRRYREGAGFSLGETADAAGIAKSTLHALEQGEGNPTLNTLWALASALAVPLGALVEESAPAVTVVRHDDGVRLPADGVEARLIHRADGGHVEVLELTIHDRVSPPHRPGVMEQLYVVSGEVETGPAAAPARLGEGDFAAFEGDVQHVYRAIGAPARALVVMSYPRSIR